MLSDAASDVVSNSAYVLYYIRKDFIEDGGKPLDYNQIKILLENDQNTVQYQNSILLK